MAEKRTKNKEVQSGDEAEVKKTKKAPAKTTAKTTSKTRTKKTDAEKKTVKKSDGKSFSDYTIRDSETAKERGRNGGIKSGEVRRAKRDARETIQYMLGRMTTIQNIRDNLKELGFEADEFTNMAALHGRLFTMAMSGNLDAYMTLMRMGGYEPEENRKERESISSDRRRELETDAKVTALGNKGDNASYAVNLNDENGDNDVVIYMPQIESEENCEFSGDEIRGEDDSADDE